MRLSLFASQMAPPIRGGWVGATRNTSTGGAQGPASRNVPVASTGTALTPSTTATAMRTINNGRSNSSPAKQNNEFQIQCFPKLNKLFLVSAGAAEHVYFNGWTLCVWYRMFVIDFAHPLSFLSRSKELQAWKSIFTSVQKQIGRSV